MSPHDITKIENSKVVVINNSLVVNATNNFKSGFCQNIFLEFVPDEVVLKYVSCVLINNDLESVTNLFTIHSNLGVSDNNNIFSFLFTPINYTTDAPADGDAYEYMNIFNGITDIHLKTPNFINRLYNFTLLSPYDFVGNVTTTINLALTFEFIKYKSIA